MKESRTNLAYEPGDASPRGVLAALGMVGAVTLLALAASGVLIRIWSGNRPAAPALGDPGSFRHGADEISSIETSWREVRESAVDGYGWVDRENGIVRIPIERAMELLASEEEARR